MSNPIFYPNVSQVPSQSERIESERTRPGEAQEGGEFGKVFLDQLNKEPRQSDLTQIRAPLKFSSHASERLKDRNIQLSPQDMAKVNDAITKAAEKGIEEALVLTKDAAFIVGVKNRTVITALDRGSVNGNVFTNIDGAIII